MTCHFVFLFSLSPARVPVGLAVLFAVSLSILVRPLKVIELYPEACSDSSRSDSFIVSSKLGLHISYWEVNTKTQEKNEHETDRRSIVVTDKGIHFLGLANLLISDVIVPAGLFNASHHGGARAAPAASPILTLGLKTVPTLPFLNRVFIFAVLLRNVNNLIDEGTTLSSLHHRTIHI